MHWIIQEGFSHEKGMEELVRLLGEYDIPHSLVKVVPIVGEIIPDLVIDDKVICFGSYSMRHTAKAKGWFPGVIDLEEKAEQIYSNTWSSHTLNADAKFCAFADVGEYIAEKGLNKFFMRPVDDSKAFAGKLFTADEYHEWRERLMKLEDTDYSTLNGDTICLCSSPKQIYAEYRLYVINGKVVTSSQYKLHDRVIYNSLVDHDVLEFGQQRVDELDYADAYCLDICRTPDGLKIVEVNTINSAGLYHADVDKLIQAFENYYANEQELNNGIRN